MQNPTSKSHSSRLLSAFFSLESRTAILLSLATLHNAACWRVVMAGQLQFHITELAAT